MFPIAPAQSRILSFGLVVLSWALASVLYLALLVVATVVIDPAITRKGHVAAFFFVAFIFLVQPFELWGRMHRHVKEQGIASLRALLGFIARSVLSPIASYVLLLWFFQHVCRDRLFGMDMFVALLFIIFVEFVLGQFRDLGNGKAAAIAGETCQPLTVMKRSRARRRRSSARFTRSGRKEERWY